MVGVIFCYFGVGGVTNSVGSEYGVVMRKKAPAAGIVQGFVNDVILAVKFAQTDEFITS